VQMCRCADATRWRRCDQAPLSAVYVHALRRVPCCCPRDVQLAAGRAAAGAARSYTGTKQLTKSYTAQIHKNIRHVIDALRNTPRNRRRVSKNAFRAYIFSQKRGVYLAKNGAYIWPKPTCNLPSLRCRLSPAERALGSRPHMGVQHAIQRRQVGRSGRYTYTTARYPKTKDRTIRDDKERRKDLTKTTLATITPEK
jgi:hypothetical protein